MIKWQADVENVEKKLFLVGQKPSTRLELADLSIAFL